MARLAILVLALAAWPSTAAAEPLRISGDALAAQHDLAAAPIEVHGGSAASAQTVVEIESPPVSGDSYALRGMVEYTGVAGDGYLELWSLFPDGSRYFSRTLDVSGPMAKLSGTSPARPFTLPFFLNGSPARPSRLVVNVVLPGAGSVRLSELRFDPAGAASVAPGAWWSPPQGGMIGGILGGALGVLGGLVGVLCSLGRGRRLVLGALAAMAAVGSASAVAGAAALALGQPYEVWYPLLLPGVLAAVLGIALRPNAVRRFDEPRPARRIA